MQPDNNSPIFPPSAAQLVLLALVTLAVPVVGIWRLLRWRR